MGCTLLQCALSHVGHIGERHAPGTVSPALVATARRVSIGSDQFNGKQSGKSDVNFQLKAAHTTDYCCAGGSLDRASGLSLLNRDLSIENEPQEMWPVRAVETFGDLLIT